MPQHRSTPSFLLSLSHTISISTYQRHGLGAQRKEKGRGKETNDAGGERDTFEGSNDVAVPALVYQDAAFLVLSFG